MNLNKHVFLTIILFIFPGETHFATWFDTVLFNSTVGKFSGNRLKSRV